MSRCGGIGRHAVLRGQWGQLRASSNLAIGTAAGFFLPALLILLLVPAAPAHALLMGEKAKHAPVNGLKVALRYYKKGASHDQVWQKTGWYCPLRQRKGCRFEVAGGCADLNKLNITALLHTSFTGKISLSKVFNAACVWQRYPALKKKVMVYFGKCQGWGGFASGDGKSGEICVNGAYLKKIFEQKKKSLTGGDKIVQAKKALHNVFLHELQHHIQFAEGWPAYREECPYERRMLEAEAYYVAGARESLIAKGKNALVKQAKKTHAPHWFREGLC